MSIEVKVPQLPESVADATLVSWHKSAGDRVSRDENLVDLETDKVVLEVPSPADGILKEIRIADGATVTSGQVLAILEEGGAAAEAAPAAAAEPESPEPAAETGKAAGKLSPAVRRLVEEHEIDPASLKGSGRDGRITKGDVVDYLEKQESGGEAAVKPAPEVKLEAAPAAPLTGAREERRVPMTRMRARIAERLVDAQATAAMLTSFNEVDLGAVMEIRKRYKDGFEKKHGVRIGFMSFFVKAAIEGLKKFPVVNASVEGSDIVYHDYYDVGVAVSTERGLVVPILRNAELMSYADVERSIVDFAGRARDGKITVDELDVHADHQSPPERDPRDAQDPGAADGGGRGDPHPADDVHRPDLRPPDHRRARGRPVPGDGQGVPRGSGPPADRGLTARPWGLGSPAAAGPTEH